MAKPTLYLMVGYPGAGKTTVSKIIAEATGAVHLWADKERHERFGVVYRHEDSTELYRRLNSETAKLLREGKSVVFDTNFNYFKDREHLRSIAALHGADTKLIWLKTPRELAYHRAVTQPSDKRMFVTMSHEDFERVANNFEPPTESEQPIEIDGTHVDPEAVRALLGI